MIGRMQPWEQVLLGMGARMLASSGSGMRTSQGLGQAILGGMSDYSTIMEQARQAENEKKQRELLEKQMEMMQQKMDTQAKQESRQAGLASFLTPGRGVMPMLDAGISSGLGAQQQRVLTPQGLGYTAAGDAYAPGMGYTENFVPTQAEANQALALEAMHQGKIGDAYAMMNPKPVTPKYPGNIAGAYQYALDNKQIPPGTSLEEFVAMTNKGKQPLVDLKIGPDGKISTDDKVVQRGLTEKIINLDQSLDEWKHILDDYDPKILTYWGQLDAGVSRIKEKLGRDLNPDEEKFLTTARRFRSKVEDAFNDYRTQVTGAAAAIAEIERLRKVFINTDLSDTEFKATYSSLFETMRRTREIYSEMLREGLDPKRGDIKDFENEFNYRWYAKKREERAATGLGSFIN